ncbi:hypothetical protein QQF64_016787 [Cirrhinus molitorella]|uniref:Uncharacterized protein n=1 Tax=Cirrhinus molitorella TaxID=172907 RepID=A0ABR3LNT5_9TELE
MHLLARTHSMSSFRKFLNIKRVQATLIDLSHPASPTSPSYHDSRQPRLSSGSRRGSLALSVIIRQSSAVRTHIAVAHAFEWLRVQDQQRDLRPFGGDQSLCARLCANARVGDPKWFTVSCE